MPSRSWPSDQALLEHLRQGDELAFASLVESLHARMLALARTFTSSPALAEDIVQETWLAVIRGLRGFEGRSALRTWIYGILVRRARTIASREAKRREIAIDNGAEMGNGEWEPGRGRYGLWEERPAPWGLEDPANAALSQETLQVVEAALDSLPPMQRQVVLLRDVEDVAPADICNILEIGETNRRVLLHRGRARIRRALDAYVRGEGTPARNGREPRAAFRDPENRPVPASESPRKAESGEGTHGVH